MEGSLKAVIGNKLLLNASPPFLRLYTCIFFFDEIYVKQFLMSNQI